MWGEGVRVDLGEASRCDIPKASVMGHGVMGI